MFILKQKIEIIMYPLYNFKWLYGPKLIPEICEPMKCTSRSDTHNCPKKYDS